MNLEPLKGMLVSNYHPEIVLMFTPGPARSAVLQTIRRIRGMSVTHRSRLEVALREAPLLPVEAIVRYILQHHLVFGVKEHITGCARSSALYVVHWEETE